MDEILLLAFVTFISGGRQILKMPRAFVDFGTDRIFGLTYPFLMMLAIAIAVWYVLERTPLGRRIYATGGNLEAARLSGIHVVAIVVGAMTASDLQFVSVVSLGADLHSHHLDRDQF